MDRVSSMDAFLAYALTESLNAEKKAQTCAQLIESGNKRIEESIKRASEADIEARDRVNIPLKEYEKMKMTIQKLTDLNLQYEEWFDKIGFPYALEVIPDSVKRWSTEVTGGPLNIPRIRFRVEFDVKKRMMP